MPKNNDLPKPVTYSQQFYAKAAGMDVDLPKAITPEQKYLQAISERGESIGNIGDVEIDNPENGEVMKYDAEQGKWINGTASGGGGTSDYTDLTNKPKINGVTLAGNKSLSDIGAADSSETYTETEVDALLAGKVDKVDGKGLSTEDFTEAEKSKLSGIAAGAEVNVQANWTQTSSLADDFIKNKPTLGAAAAKGVDSTPTASSTNLVESGGVDAALAAKLNTADVDAALSSTSTNPVQNKAVQAPIARLIDAGSKNLFDFEAWLSSLTGATRGTITRQNQSITLTATGNDAYTTPQVNGFHILVKPNTEYVITVESADSNGQLVLLENDAFSNFYTLDTGVGILQFKTSSSANRLSARFGVPTSGSASTISNVMLCTAEDYAISPEFVPYAPSNRELYEKVETKADILPADRRAPDINTAINPGIYRFYGSGQTANLPSDMMGTAQFGLLEVFVCGPYIKQVLTHFKSSEQAVPPNVYIRRSADSGVTWGPWGKFGVTAVT